MECISLSFLKGNTKEQVDILPHALDRADIQEEWLYDCIVKDVIRGVLQQREDRYRLYYKHPTKGEKYDLIIVIDIKKSSPITIKVVTSYIQLVNRRVR